jgi:hypothetical protein
MSIADLEVIADITEKPYFFLHYLAGRYRVQKAVQIMADELDFLGLYLESGFNIYQMEKEKVGLVITGMSQVVDHYYDSINAGVSVQKPKPKVGAYFEKLLNGLDMRRPFGWLSWSSYLLSSASYREQRKLDRMLENLRVKAKKTWRSPSREIALGCFPPEGRGIAVVYIVLPPQIYERRKELVSNVLGNMLAQYPQTRCLIVGRNTERWDDPYAWIGMAGLADP